MLPLALRNLFFVIIQPGVVAGIIPFLMEKQSFRTVLTSRFTLFHYTGIIIFIVGILTVLHCTYKFALNGRGTLSPADPTQHLVITGLYRFTRNPMYIGVLLILVGEVIFIQSFYLLIYGIVVFISFHAFVVWVEEPRLKNDFGEEYEQYVRQVRRWL